MTTTEERLATLERDVENEQEWRREMLKEMRDGFARLDAKFNWTIGLLIALLIAIIASNWIGQLCWFGTSSPSGISQSAPRN